MWEHETPEFLSTLSFDMAFRFSSRTDVKIREEELKRGPFSEVITLIVKGNNVFNSLQNVIAEKFFDGISELKAVYFHEEGDTINVWSVLGNFGREIREKVYAKEGLVIKAFPDLVFNFRTTDVLGENVPASAGFRKVTSKSLTNASL